MGPLKPLEQGAGGCTGGIIGTVSYAQASRAGKVGTEDATEPPFTRMDFSPKKLKLKQWAVLILYTTERFCTKSQLTHTRGRLGYESDDT